MHECNEDLVIAYKLIYNLIGIQLIEIDSLKNFENCKNIEFKQIILFFFFLFIYNNARTCINKYFNCFSLFFFYRPRKGKIA